MMRSKVGKVFAGFRTAFVTLCTSKRGNISVSMACLLPILLGVFGLGFEISIWHQLSHAMRDAHEASGPNHA